MSIATELTTLLGCERPVMLAGMGGIAGKELVAAVSRAGGFGTWGTSVSVAKKDPDELLEELLEIKEACGGRPFGVDILVHGADGGVMDMLIQVFAKGGAKAFISGRGFPRAEVVKKFHDVGMLVGSIAGKVKHAQRAVEAGVDFIIAQGSEGGGHTGQIASSVLLPAVVDAVAGRVPVVAAGGVCDGRGLASALAFGAAGVWVGTRFLMTEEATTHQKYKEHLLKAACDDTTISRAFTGHPLRVLKNDYTDYFVAHPEELKHGGMQTVRSTQDGVWCLHSGTDTADGRVKDGSTGKIWKWEDVNYRRQAFVAGQCIGMIDKIEPAGKIVVDMCEDAGRILGGRQQNFTLRTARL